jgi:hypothetical protein
MDPTILQIKPETAARIREHAKQLGVSVDEFLRRLLPPGEEIALEPVNSDHDFELDMEVFAEGTESTPFYEGSYSREDIYSDHD